METSATDIDGVKEPEEEGKEESVTLRSQWNALEEACRTGRLSVVKDILLPPDVSSTKLGPEYLATAYDTKTKSDEENDMSWIPRWDPLTIAVNEGHGEIARFLLEQGFGEAWTTPSLASLLGETTPLHRAALRGHIYILCDLLEHFPESWVRRTDDLGNTPLHLASAAMPREGDKDTFDRYLKMLELLIYAGSRCDAKNRHGNTPRSLCTNANGRAFLARCRERQEGQMRSRAALLSVAKLRDDTAALRTVCDEVESPEDGSISFDCERLGSLECMIETARRSCVPREHIERAERIRNVLVAKAALENAVDDLNRLRPCNKVAQTTRLRNALDTATAEGVDDASLTRAGDLLDTVRAELQLKRCVAFCASVSRADMSHVMLRDRLDRSISRCAERGGNESLVRRASLILEKMRVEITLQQPCPMPSTRETEGLVPSQIEVMKLTMQVEHLSKALKVATSDGVSADGALVRETRQRLKALRVELASANEAEAARLEEEEKSRQRALKKKSKKKKKKKK